ncbi:hypothetical protein [Nonlabens sp.]|uniref:hypothetical protein n=1 Tax=Nonlabens sp. TaxID=1888209 RepID=UPI003F695290
MKKILFIIALAVSGLGYAQAPQITQAQLENSRTVKEKTDKFNALIDQKVDEIMTAGNLDTNKRGALLEIVMNKESHTASIERENISDTMKQSKLNAVHDGFKKQLISLIGEKKYNLVENALNSK